MCSFYIITETLKIDHYTPRSVMMLKFWNVLVMCKCESVWMLCGI